MLLHLQEQKMALAVQCYDLVDTHVQNLARNLDGLREELEVTTLSRLAATTQRRVCARRMVQQQRGPPCLPRQSILPSQCTDGRGPHGILYGNGSKARGSCIA